MTKSDKVYEVLVARQTIQTEVEDQHLVYFFKFKLIFGFVKNPQHF